jgi:hypothetical protein
MNLDIPQRLVGQRCWYVSAGGVTAPSFSLALGEQIPRARPLTNTAHPPSFRHNEGSFGLLVWCSWRLQTDSNVLATSDTDDFQVHLDSLTDAVVDAVLCRAPAWDLELRFSNGETLLIFCDNHGSDPTASQNWELWVPGTYVQAGLAGEWHEEPDPDESDS